MSVTARTTIQLLWRDPSVVRFAAGVSLHSHTMYSEETLDTLPAWTDRVPYFGSVVRRKLLGHTSNDQKHLQFGNGFWTPPLAPRQAYRLEEKQINRRLHLPALVSLTDHDDIRAASQLRVVERFRDAPISCEWTIPFESTFFHLGVHNLRACDAVAIFTELKSYTARPERTKLSELLALLNAYPDVLIVLNHPLWDERGIGTQRHERVLRNLLQQHREWIHALEVNGIRNWHENEAVIAMARDWGIPAVSGGDRHGREPNSVLNLSRGTTFEAFVHEVRRERTSHIVVMPQYREPRKLRVLQMVLDVLRDYPENPRGRRSWQDRVFFRDPLTGSAIPFSAVCREPNPACMKQLVSFLSLLEWRGLRSALTLALPETVPIWADSDVRG